jgi:hypothetical protein
MNEEEIELLMEIVTQWKEKIDEFAGGYISTKYSRL